MRRLFAGIFLSLLATNTVLAANQIAFWEEDGVRLVFQKNKTNWRSRQVRVFTPQALERLPDQFAQPSSWLVFHHGTSSGTVKTTRFPRYELYAQVGLQKIQSAPAAPSRTESSDFATWAKSSGLRPVLLTDTAVRDPEGWSPENGTPKHLIIAKNEFVKRFASRLKFAKDSQFKFTDSKRRLTAEDLTVVKVFRSRGGEELIGLKPAFQNTFARCRAKNGFCAALATQWFLAGKKRVTSLGDGAAFIDAADVDGNSRSEFFFFLNRNNESGYALVNAQGVRTEYTWSFH